MIRVGSYLQANYLSFRNLEDVAGYMHPVRYIVVSGGGGVLLFAQFFLFIDVNHI